jgi:hypothetical protein
MTSGITTANATGRLLSKVQGDERRRGVEGERDGAATDRYALRKEEPRAARD